MSDHHKTYFVKRGGKTVAVIRLAVHQVTLEGTGPTSAIYSLADYGINQGAGLEQCELEVIDDRLTPLLQSRDRN